MAGSVSQSVCSLAVIVSLILPGCGGKTRADRPNLLLITMDTTRADKLGAYGCPDIRTPAIDGLARDGVLFLDAHASVPITLPSHCTIMTGLYSLGHGVRNNGNYVLPDGVTTLAEVLSREGYATAAFVGAYVLDSQFGLSQGFGTYDDSFREYGKAGASYFGYLERPAVELTERALSWIDSASEPFFLWLHYFDPHYPYLPPPPFDVLYARDPYLGEIAYVDSCIGRVVAKLEEKGLSDRCLVVLTSDHGESLGEHGELSHGLFLYEATTHVPLIMKYPAELPGGSTLRGAVSLVDLFPTVCDLLGVGFPEAVQGKSLRPMISGAGTARLPIYMETVIPRENFGWSGITGVLDGGWKYLRVTEPELYHLEEDRSEERNLYHEEPGRVSGMETLLSSLEKRLGSGFAGGASTSLDQDTREKLEKLGYVRSAGSGAASDVDPKRMVAVVNGLDYGMYLVTKQDFLGAIRVFEEILAMDPNNLTAHNFLGASLMSIGKENEALYHWRKVIELNPGNIDAHRNLALALEARGLTDEARREFDAVLGLNPSDVKALTGLGGICLDRGETEKALGYLTRASRIDTEIPRVHFLLGKLYEKEQGVGAALESFERAVALDSTDVEMREALARALRELGRREEAASHLAWVAEKKGDLASYVKLGFLLDRLGRHEQAVETFEKALAADSVSFEAYNGLGISLLSLKKYDEAEACFEKAISLGANYAEPYYNLGNLYRQTGRLQEAVESYTKFLALWKGKGEVREGAVRALEELGAQVTQTP